MLQKRCIRFATMAILLALLITPMTASADNTALVGRAQEECPYEELVVTLLFPRVEEAIQDYYSEYMNTLPSEDPWSYHFTRLEKTPDKNYAYSVIVMVQPYVGPHLSVGLDRVTLSVGLDGVTVEKFEHLKSYELPPNYADIFKKPLPET